MAAKKTFLNKINSFLYNHIWLKIGIDYVVTFIMSVLSAAIFAFGIVCFLRPTSESIELVSGGSSGLAQVISLIFTLSGIEIKNNSSMIFTIAYLVINTPLLILAFAGIGKRFGFFSMVNVISVSVLTNVFSDPSCASFFNSVGAFIGDNAGLLARSLFAGLCTGISSALAFKFDTSAGGFDIISYYLGLRKGTTIGKYNVLINAAIICAFYLLTAISKNTLESWTTSVSNVFFSVIYLFTVMLVIDAINVRNKKVQIQIITKNEDLAKTLLVHVPHGATVIDSKGAYSGEHRKIIYMVISSIESKKVIKFVKKFEPEAFINIMPLQQVYGRFFTKPIK